jgi:hypothetical protein
MARDTVDDKGPRHVRRLAPQLAIDEVAEPAERQAERRERRDEVGHLEEAAAQLAPIQPQGGHHAEQAAVKGHAAFPDTQQHDRVAQPGIEVVEQDRAEPAADDDADGGIEDEVVDVCWAVQPEPGCSWRDGAPGTMRWQSR